MRAAIGIVVGIIVAMATIWALEAVTHTIFPPSAPMDMNDAAGMARIVAAMPVAAKVLVLVGWLIGATVGTFTAATVARRNWAGWVPAAIVLAGGIANLFLIPHPWWMAIGAIVTPVLGGWLGVRLAQRRVAAP